MKKYSYQTAMHMSEGIYLRGQIYIYFMSHDVLTLLRPVSLVAADVIVDTCIHL